MSTTILGDLDKKIKSKQSTKKLEASGEKNSKEPINKIKDNKVQEVTTFSSLLQKFNVKSDLIQSNEDQKIQRDFEEWISVLNPTSIKYSPNINTVNDYEQYFNVDIDSFINQNCEEVKKEIDAGEIRE